MTASNPSPQKSMYETGFARAKAEVDPNIDQMISDLRAYLYGESDNKIYLRYAPSIVARSEAELLGLSRPRFAIRAYLGEHSFVNMRRRILVAESITLHYEQLKKEALAKKLVKQLTSGGAGRSGGAGCTDWIADSLLSPPQTEIDFEYLTTKLATDYGEPVEFASVPYMTHVRIGGGMCAQAAAFIGLCLSGAKKKILGPSELTRLAFEQNDSIPLDGFTHVEFQEVLGHKELGTSAVLQIVPYQDNSLLFNVLRAYLRSGIPIILLVSLSRIAGAHQIGMRPEDCVAPILSNRDSRITKLIPEETWTDSFVPMNIRRDDHHCVVVVGWSKSRDDLLFSIHDPATLPFLQASPEQLLDVRRYEAPPKEKIGFPRISIELDELEALREPYQYLELIPLAPSGVINPLASLPVFDKEQNIVGFGLYSVIETMTGNPDNDVGIHYGPNGFTGDQLLLVSSRVLENPSTNCSIELRKLSDDIALIQLLKEEIKSGYRWLALFSSPDVDGKAKQSVWLWEAETRVPGEKSLLKVIAYQQRDGLFRWQTIFTKSK